MAKKKKTPTNAAPKEETTYKMPLEVKEWIDQATSRIKYLTGEVERLKAENANLKAYRRFAEARILNVSQE